MSEELSELHPHDFYAFDGEILDMARTKNQTKPQKKPTSDSSRDLVVREDADERTGQPLRVGISEEEANVGPVPTGTPYTAKEFEAAVIPRKLRHQGALEKIDYHMG